MATATFRSVMKKMATASGIGCTINANPQTQCPLTAESGWMRSVSFGALRVSASLDGGHRIGTSALSQQRFHAPDIKLGSVIGTIDHRIVGAAEE